MSALSPIYDRECSGASKEALAAVRSWLGPYKHQMFGHDRAGLTRGVCRVQAPAAHKAQACKLGRGDASPVLSHSHRSVVLPPDRRRALRGSFLLPDNRGARRLIIATGSSRSRAKSLPHQHCVQAIADRRFIHLKRLSTSDLVGIDPNEIGLTHAQKSFAPGAKTND